MLFGVSPNVDIGIPDYGLPMVVVLRAPNFFPKILTIDSADSIGSGAAVEVYTRELQSLNQNPNLLQMEGGVPGGYGFILHTMIQRVIEDYPQASVSPHVHYCLVRRGRIQIGNSDRTVVHGAEWTEVRMPPVATSWPEFLRIAEAAELDASAAHC